MTLARFAFPCPIVFGAGARHQVASHLRDAGVRRPLIVTDRGLAALPLLAQFSALLEGLDVAVYAGVHGNPPASQVMAGAQAFKDHRADAVIGLGGGAWLTFGAAFGAPTAYFAGALGFWVATTVGLALAAALLGWLQWRVWQQTAPTSTV